MSLQIFHLGQQALICGVVPQIFNVDFSFLHQTILGLSGNDKRHQSHSDGILEVFAIYSSFHMAQLQVGMSAPKALGRASVVEVFAAIACTQTLA